MNSGNKVGVQLGYNYVITGSPNRFVAFAVLIYRLQSIVLSQGAWDMKNSKLSLSIVQNKLAVCRLEKDTQVPSWAMDDTFYSISRTNDELSIVCSEDNVPDNIKSDKNWRAFKVEGPLDFSLTGVLVSLANPLAEAQISIFAISTYDTDYLLVKDNDFEKAVKVLETFCNVRH